MFIVKTSIATTTPREGRDGFDHIGKERLAYEEIKSYVKENGIVSIFLYITQVKRICGIIGSENFNKAKSEDWVSALEDNLHFSL